MSIFRNPDDEEKLCQALRAFVQEWGAELVVVSLPRSWRPVSSRALGRVRVECTTFNTISIRVGCDHVDAKFEIELDVASSSRFRESKRADGSSIT